VQNTLLTNNPALKAANSCCYP